MVRTTGIPSPEVTGPICRFPWGGLSQHAFPFSGSQPVSVLGMDMGDPSKLPFHGLQESAELRIRGAIPTFTSFSSLRDSGGFEG
jgi:hypothetical protein